MIAESGTPAPNPRPDLAPQTLPSPSPAVVAALPTRRKHIFPSKAVAFLAMVLMVAAQFLFLVRLEDWWDAAAYGCVVASYSLWIGYFSYIYFYKAVDPSKKSQTALRGWACGLLFTLGVLGLVQRAEPAVKRVGLSSFGLAASLLFVTAALAPVPPTPVFTTPMVGTRRFSPPAERLSVHGSGLQRRRALSCRRDRHRHHMHLRRSLRTTSEAQVALARWSWLFFFAPLTSRTPALRSPMPPAPSAPRVRLVPRRHPRLRPRRRRRAGAVAQRLLLRRGRGRVPPRRHALLHRRQHRPPLRLPARRRRAAGAAVQQARRARPQLGRPPRVGVKRARALPTAAPPRRHAGKKLGGDPGERRSVRPPPSPSCANPARQPHEIQRTRVHLGNRAAPPSARRTSRSARSRRRRRACARAASPAASGAACLAAPCCASASPPSSSPPALASAWCLRSPRRDGEDETVAFFLAPARQEHAPASRVPRPQRPASSSPCTCPCTPRGPWSSRRTAANATPPPRPCARPPTPARGRPLGRACRNCASTGASPLRSSPPASPT